MRELNVIESQAPIDCCAPLSAATLSDEEATATAALFGALADPARVRIYQHGGDERGARVRLSLD